MWYWLVGAVQDNGRGTGQANNLSSPIRRTYFGEPSKLQILLITKCLIITDEPNDNNINHKQTHKVSNKNCVKNHVA